MDAVREFLTALQTERGASPHTLAAYRRDLTGFVTFLGRGGRAVATARVGDLTEYLAALRRRGLGARSTARHLSAVRGLYRFLLGSGGIRRDPTEHLETPRPPRRLPRTLSVEDAAALVEAPDISVPEGLRDRALLELMYASGLRASECLTLRLEDLNQAAGYVMAEGHQYTFSAPTLHGRSGLYESIAMVHGVKVKFGWIVLPNGHQVGSAIANPDSADPQVSAAPPLDPATGTAEDDGVALIATLISGVTGSGF